MTEQTLPMAVAPAGEVLRRRNWLTRLGTALLALAIGSLSHADKADASKKTKRIKQKKCKKQVARCRAAFEAECQGDPACDPVLACCDVFSNCNADAGLRCLFSLPEPSPTAQRIRGGLFSN